MDFSWLFASNACGDGALHAYGIHIPIDFLKSQDSLAFLLLVLLVFRPFQRNAPILFTFRKHPAIIKDGLGKERGMRTYEFETVIKKVPDMDAAYIKYLLM